MTDLIKLSTEEVGTFTKAIETVRKHEVKTKALIGSIMPIALQHVWGHNSVGLLNTLIHALSPANKKVALVFFDTMTSHIYGGSKANKSVKEYGKRDKSTTFSARLRAERFFDLDEDGKVDLDMGYYGGDYWLFVENEVKVESKRIDYYAMLDKAVDGCIDENKGGFSSEEVMKHLIDKVGIDKSILLSLLEA